MSESKRYYGTYRATVVNNVDPENRGRIQVRLADRYGAFPPTWALPSFPVAGLQHGVVCIPPLDATVWIDFEAGDPDFPVWRGGFFELPGEMPVVVLSDNTAQSVLINTSSGAMISVGESGIVISNGKGASISLTGPSVIVNGGALTVT
jgi:uncharacterized protein involved in type VI secretion and phage assembly